MFGCSGEGKGRRKGWGEPDQVLGIAFHNLKPSPAQQETLHQEQHYTHTNIRIEAHDAEDLLRGPSILPPTPRAELTKDARVLTDDSALFARQTDRERALLLILHFRIEIDRETCVHPSTCTRP